MGQRVTPATLFLALLAFSSAGPVSGEEYWAYVPDPPILQPVTWRAQPFTVYSNDTVALGGHSSAHIQPQSIGYTYTGRVNMLPICFSMGKNVSGCLTMGSEVGYSTKTSDWKIRLPDLSKDTAGEPEVKNGTGPLNIPFCGMNEWSEGKEIPWKLCRNTSAEVWSILISTEKVCDWSSHSDKNPGQNDNRPFVYRLWGLN